jgi:hypothetical protein
VAITSNTKVLATLQSGADTFERLGRDPAAGTITLFLTKASRAPVTVAYFVIS